MTTSVVTGAGGFVGMHLCRRLSASEEVQRVSSRSGIASWCGPGLLDGDEAALVEALTGADRIYFLAGIAHEAVAGGDSGLLRRVNVDAPLRWLRAADRAGVRRFVWLSSIKVLGDTSSRPLTPDDPYRPGDDYARSKVEAEECLLSEPLATTEVAVVRPPLVYGPGVRGNFRALLRLAAGGWPLPLGSANAPRSLVAVDNLCDLLVRLGTDGRGIYHVTDGDDITVSHLVAELRRLQGLPRRQFSVPPPLARGALTLGGRGALYQRLFEPLQVDMRGTSTQLGWLPATARSDALQETVTWFRTSP